MTASPSPPRRLPRLAWPSHQLTAAQAYAALLFAGLLAGGTGVRAQPQPQAGGHPAAPLERAIAGAEAALHDNELQIAESRYRAALLEGLLLLGSLSIEGDDLAAAKTAFDEAARVAVETRRPLTSLALVRLELGETAAALDLLREIVVGSPADLEARRLLARALAASDRLDEAVHELEQSRALAPDDLEILFQLATAYLRQERPEAAEPLFAELTEKRPIPQAWILIGRVQRDFGYYDRAREALEKALELDPRVRRAHYYLGTIDLLDQGRGMLEEAMANFEAELVLAPEDPMSNLYLGIGLVESRRHEEALPRLETASRLGASQRDAFQFLGRSYLALGRPREAVGALRKALELAGASAVETPEGVYVDLGESQIASIHYQLALALRRSGDEEAARVHFEASKQSSAKVAESSRQILRRYLEGETRTTTADAGSLLGGSPLAALSPERRREMQAQIRTALAQCYLNLGVLLSRAAQPARAAELFARGADLEPDFPRLQYSLGAAWFNAGRFDLATGPLARALAASPADAELRRMLALARLSAGEYAAAVELLREDPERASNRSLEYAYGLALVRSGRASEAEVVFARLLASNADWPELNVLLGQAHAQQDDYDSAIRFLSRAIEIEPTVAEAHATLGDIYLRQGKLDEAESELRAELRLHPEDARAQYTLAVVLDLNRKTDEARAVLESLLETEPRSADGRYLLGKILLAEGDQERALQLLRTAVDLAPDDPNIHYQLGQALQKLGRTDEARAAFETFRRLKDEQRSGGAS